VRYHQSEPRLTFIALPAIVLIFIAGLEKVSGGNRRANEKLALILPALPYILFLLH